MTGRVGSRRPDPALGGGAVWLLALMAGAAGAGELTLVDALLLLGILVVVPLAVPLVPGSSRGHAAAALLAGAPTAPALLLDRGLLAGLLVLPWLAAAGAGTVLVAGWCLSGRRHVLDVVWIAAAVYLLVGAGWLVADRLDLQPVGFAAPFVQLTAVHFHFAGSASSVLAGCLLGWREGRLPRLAAALVVAAPPVVAVGFVVYGPLQIAGAVLLTAGLWILAWETIRGVAPNVGRLSGALLIVSGLAVLAPMVLAVQWAVGANYATPALSIPEMARLHGITNAVGFTLVGVLGWRGARPVGPGGARSPDPG